MPRIVDPVELCAERAMCHGLSRTDFHMMLLDGVDLSLGERGLCEVRAIAFLARGQHPKIAIGLCLQYGLDE